MVMKHTPDYPNKQRVRRWPYLVPQPRSTKQKRLGVMDRILPIAAWVTLLGVAAVGAVRSALMGETLLLGFFLLFSSFIVSRLLGFLEDY